MAAIPLDHKIKAAVAAWHEKDYEGASPVTQPLLEFWFEEEHWLKDGSEFRFWRAQREAMEGLIYVYEVCRYHNLIVLDRLNEAFEDNTIFRDFPFVPPEWDNYLSCSLGQ